MNGGIVEARKHLDCNYLNYESKIALKGLKIDILLSTQKPEKQHDTTFTKYLNFDVFIVYLLVNIVIGFSI